MPATGLPTAAPAMVRNPPSAVMQDWGDSTTPRAVQQAKDWAQKRQAQIENALKLREEREKRKQQEMQGQSPPSDPYNPEQRHLPTCTCPHCKTPQRPVSRGSGNPSPSPTHRPTHTGEIEGPTSRPTWNNDFTDDCKNGFEELHHRRLLDQRRAERRLQRQQQQQQHVPSSSPQTRYPQHQPKQPSPPKTQIPQRSASLSHNQWQEEGTLYRPSPSFSNPPTSFAQPAKERPKEGGTKSNKSSAPPPPPQTQPVAPPQSNRRNSEDEGSHGGGPSTRMNFDKRTSRHQHRDRFLHTINNTSFLDKLTDGHLAPSSVNIYTRKRPLFDYESQRGEYDVLTVDPHASRIVVHNCLMHPDMVRMHVVHQAFPSTMVFPETAANTEVYKCAAQPLVSGVARGQGEVALILMYGQTGSGKTYTMTAIEEMSCRDIYSNMAHGLEVLVSIFEIAGKSCHDLLSTTPSEVTFLDGGDGSMQLCGAMEAKPRNASDLFSLIKSAKQRRKTHSTAINATSSRSHSVCQISVAHPSGQIQGRLMLVDCAGSERKEDSAYHTAERRKEGAEINASIHSLKECMRALVSGAKHVPFRTNVLTKALKESFTMPGSRIAVIATVSPTATDTEHSIGTLRTVCSWRGCEDMIYEKKEDAGSSGTRDFLRRATEPTPVIPSAVLNNDTDALARQATRRAQQWANKRRALMESAAAAKAVSSAQNAQNANRGPIPAPQKGATGSPPSPKSTPRQVRHSSQSITTSNPGRENENPMMGGGPGMSYPKSEATKHPSRWSPEEARHWVMHRVRCVLPGGVDGKSLLRWNLSKCISFCDNDERRGLLLFNGLRLESDHASEMEKNKRKQHLRR